ncbi:AAA family ATPase [Fluviispira multicolorata]|uniref:Exonuclease SbcC n=1 Tax=Fluviispira multicolorata TaxID=2654512 RepID=A0A833N4Q4_9BACT|nr:AAA family ATPase [Fluviispira multicolorata]KAB8028534.1 hypothetical protein GCL57_12475 [Fluviispira multicolorata]
MKLLKIELENLNSLYGRHSIDFVKDLQGAPIFLIMGPTGAGKSTLMDAMTLALFGQTPRLTKNKADKDIENDCRQIMSRGTAIAFAQLTFQKLENNSLKKYRATWQCERAYKKPDGNFKDPRRILEYFDESSQEFIEIISDHRPKFYEPYFEKILEHLNVNDFKRMVLLAQGEFAAFLKANEDERAEILERLTNTEIYKEIGKKASDKKKDLEEKLKSISASLNGVLLLTQEQESQLKNIKNINKIEILSTEAKLKTIHQSLMWFEKKEELERKYFEANEKYTNLILEINKHQFNFDKLNNYKKAQRAIEFILSKKTVQKNILEIKQNIFDNKVNLTKLNDENKILNNQLVRCKEDLITKKAFYSTKKNEINNARSLQQERNRLLNDILFKKEILSHSFNQLKIKQIALTHLQQNKQFATSEKEVLLDSLKNELLFYHSEYINSENEFEFIVKDFENAKLEIFELIKPYAHPNEKISSYELEKNHINDVLKSITQLIWKQQIYEEKILKKQEILIELNSLNEKHTIENNNILIYKDILHDNQIQLEKLKDEISNLSWAMEIAKKRYHLNNGEDCPLCGSQEHPYFLNQTFLAVDQAVLEKHNSLSLLKVDCEKKYLELHSKIKFSEATKSSIELSIKKIESELNAINEQILKQEQEIKSQISKFLDMKDFKEKNLLEELKNYENIYSDKCKEIDLKNSHLMQCYEKYNILKENYTEKKDKKQIYISKSEELKRIIQNKCKDFHVDSFINRNINLVQNYRSVSETNNTLESLKKIEEKIEVNNNEIIRLSVEIEGISENIKNAEKDLSHSNILLTNCKVEINNHLNGEDPDNYESSLIKKLEETERILKTYENTSIELNKKVTYLNYLSDNMGCNFKNLTFENENLEKQINFELHELNMEREEDILSFQLSNEQYILFNNLLNSFEKNIISFSEIKLQRENDIKEHISIKPVFISEQTQTDLISEIEKTENFLAIRYKENNEIYAKLINNDENKKRNLKIQSELEKIQHEYSTWLKLHQLIGVGEGNQFKKFAQILNLEELIAKANIHLARFEKRYSLAPAQDINGSPRLAFAIKDSYHAEEIRSFKTLSGGEIFLVSLALALALADYRSVKMPVETILLDEGFGTLDPATLQITMSALESLHTNGTQVGIISHVEALKESIASRIIVEKQGNGQSSLRIEL